MMSGKRHRHPVAWLAGLILFAGSATAGQLFTWVDETGVTHFSQWPPASPDVAASTLTLPRTNPPDYDPKEDPNSVLRQAERIQEDWSVTIGEEEGERRAIAGSEERRRPPYREPGLRIERRLFFPVYAPPARRAHAGERLGRRQRRALDALELAEGPRPYSVNSSLHRARVDASRELPRRPVAREPGRR